MSTELAKAFEPAPTQLQALELWNRANAFHAEPTDPGKPYSIVIPPPNVTAALHLGHALNNTLQDILIRWHRMMGDNTCWLPGTDHAGIATQTVVEKRVMAEEGKRRTDFAREEFVGKIQAWKDEYEARITDQLKAMGCSCDFDRQAFTMDEPRAKAVREAFFQLFKDGLIYRGKRLVNWDPVTQTALADDEVENEEIDGNFYYLRYPLTDGTSYVTVATTRPETMLGDTAVAMNPKDPRAASLRGKKVRLPIVNREIPIIEDDYVVLSIEHGGDPKDVKAQFATGFLKVTPAHDPNDYDIGLRHKLPMINVFSPTAAISKDHGWPADDFAHGDEYLKSTLIGKDRFEARKLVVKWFKEKGLLEQMKPYKHSVGHSYRSHVPIEPYLSDQWYCRVTDPRLAKAALRAMVTDQSDPTSPDRQGGGSAQPASGSAFSATAKSPSPHIYLITFTTKGARLHGDPRGTVDRRDNIPGTPIQEPDPELEALEARQLAEPPFTLDAARRGLVLQAIIEVSRHRAWALHAAHVRTDHVHVVVTATAAPEKVMNDFKAYATRALRGAGQAGPDETVWTRHGSTRWVDLPKSLSAAIQYVVEEQGEFLEPGAFFETSPDREGGGRAHGAAPTQSPETADSMDLQTRTPSAANAQMQTPAAPAHLPDGRGSSGRVSWERQLRFYPARYAKTFQNWHENIRDWCISRQLWWGHRIPVWSLAPGRQLNKSEIDRLLKLEEDPHIAVAHVSSEPGSCFTVPFYCVRSGHRDLECALEELGFVQDPDVLDTWFSSALWPLSTLGWPDPSALSTQHSALNIWNPTSVLCTAREIITLWVSRMVMFNLYFLNRLPFKDVFIHAMIQDGHGQKMSKTLGNGVDPMDIIGSHGADAMRFTMAHMATNTQDVRMPVDMVDPHTGETFTPKFVTVEGGYLVAAPIQDSPRKPGKKIVSSYGLASGKAKPTPDMPVAKNTSSKFDEASKFCNKIWQAAKFVLTMLEKEGTKGEGSCQLPVASCQPSALPIADCQLPIENAGNWQTTTGNSLYLPDRWILTRFARTLKDAEEGLNNYRFDQYAKACYDFFWGDFCDWYIETAKIALRDPARAGQTARVIAAVLDASLRLLHPAMPFITEVLYQKLREVCPQRGLTGILPACGADMLIRAAWPRPQFIDDAAEASFARVQQIITTIRNLRNEYKLNPRKMLGVSVLAPAELAAVFTGNREGIESLASCELKAAGPDVTPPADSVRTPAGGGELFVEGLTAPASQGLDPAEAQRLGKKLEELQKEEKTLEGRLANPSYASKAPPHLVQQTKDRLAEVKAEIEKIKKLPGQA